MGKLTAILDNSSYMIMMIISVLFYVILFTGQIMEFNFPMSLNIFFVVIIFTIIISIEFSILNKDFISDFKIRSYSRKFKFGSLFNAIFWTGLIVFDNQPKRLFILILILWIYPFIDIVMVYVFRKKQPYTIFINNRNLILNRPWKIERDLSELTEITFDRFSKNLNLSFQTKSDITIQIKEFNKQDIDKFVEIIITKSENNVCLPENYI
ncbi:hypothetical protein [Flavobacterium stagni]|uniref:DUF5673 domain-containing protein n=1 Tax=Flavobacterium stagni TaxID=2506421 RepID=A0A4Q1K6V9_9FLAO|nr:hypothetical protein [Flavobacterium stagni]RXR21597.1 hypothetical protein EQG61_11335 [Flavobacterium stagni]